MIKPCFDELQIKEFFLDIKTSFNIFLAENLTQAKLDSSKKASKHLNITFKKMENTLFSKNNLSELSVPQMVLFVLFVPFVDPN